jgi:peptidoglycan/xylan/chitin deacetylase (PgdA/CDA1 family)
MGQFNKCINYIYTQNPTARVIVIAPWNGRNVGAFPDYWYGWNNGAWGKLATELQKACEYYWIPFISQQTSPMNGYTIQSLIGADGTHPNVEGYKRIGEWVAHELLNLTANGVTYKHFTQEMNTLTTSVKSTLKQYNAINLIPEPTVAENTKSGITMSAINGEYTINGTASNVWFYDVDGSTTSCPADFVAGETYRITFEPTDPNIYLRIWQYDENNPSGTSILFTNTSATFTVPTNITGLLVRLHIVKGRTVNGTVKPIVSKNLTNAQLEKLIANEIPPAMLTIIDDDGHIGFMNDLLPLIESKHIPIATAITETRIGSESKWMTWEQILDCYSKGAEVLCHTYNHDPDTPNLDVNLIEHQYTMARNNMFRHGLHNADILVYNNDTGSSEKCQEAAARVFKCAIHSSGRVINYAGAINPHYVQRIPVELDPYYYDVEQLKALIDQNIAQGGWMVWIIHTSATSWSTYNGANAIATAIDYAIEKGLPIVSTDYGYRKYIARE